MRAPLAKSTPPKPAPSPKKAAPAQEESKAHQTAKQALFAVLEPLLIEEPAPFSFEGALRRKHVEQIWRWIVWDVRNDLPETIAGALEAGESEAQIFDRLGPEIGRDVRAVLAEISRNANNDHRLTVQMGGEDVRADLDRLLLALRSRRLLDKAKAFGKATNSLADEQAVVLALQSIPLDQVGQTSILMQAIVGQTANPARLVSAAVTLSGRTTEDSVRAAGFGPLIEAVLAHAQNQLTIISGNFGLFSDIDLVCRSLDRFHRLLRAVDGYLDLERNGRWAHISSELTKSASAKIEPRLRAVSGDVTQCLRRSREGAGALDADQWLAALNGLYLLVTVRDARDSLALNALFEQAWRETGQALEALIERNLNHYRADPNDRAAAQRLEYGTKMAKLRFGKDYADVLEKARQSLERRSTAAEG